MNQDKTALEKLIDIAEDKNIVTAESARSDAEDFLKWLKSSVYVSKSDELKVFDELIARVKQQKGGNATKNLAKRARSHFEEHVYPWLQTYNQQIRHAQSTQPNPPPPSTYAESVTHQTRQRSTGNSEHREEENGRKPRNDSGQNTTQPGLVPNMTQPGHVPNTTQHRLVGGHHNDSAKPNRQWTPEQIADGFMDIYNDDWTEAYEQVKKHGKDEITIYAFLLKIVEEAYKNSRRETDEQIKQMEICALQIVIGNNTKPLPKALPKTDVSLLKQYRKDHADVSVDRIKQNFVDKILPGIHTQLKLQRAAVIDVFAGLCVEITWWMTVQDPPIYMVCDDKGKEFNEKMYEPIIKSGKRINYIIWPPLLLYKDGPVLQRGKAVGQ